MKEKLKHIIAPVAVLLMVIFVWHKTGIYFETNDDKCITEILCGLMTGEPEARTVYVSYLLALPLSVLYSFTSKIPWYGLVLILCQVFAYTAALESIYSRLTKWVEAAAGTVLTALMLLVNLYLLSCIEFTSTAALMAAAGYFCLLVHNDPKKGRFCFCLLELFAGLLRLNSMLMMQPMGLLIIGGVLLGRKDMSLRDRVVAWGKAVLVPTAVFLMLLSVDAFVYRESGWKAYMKYLDAETVLFDYRGIPSYEEVKNILDRYQVSETDYYAYRSYMIPDWILSPECAEEIAGYVQEHGERVNVQELWEKLRKNLFEDSHWKVNSVIVFLWAAAAVQMLVVKKASFLLSALALLFGKVFSWGYLLYQGRFPLRVSMPLLAGEIFLLSALMLVYREQMKVSMRYGMLLALLFGMCITGISTGRQQYYYILGKNTGQKIFMAGLREIGAYCNDHPDNRYIIDAVSAGYYEGSALETEIYQDRNYIVAGNWYSNSPNVRRYNAKYLAEGEGVYFLVYDDGRGADHPGVAYLMQETGADPEICDRITVSHGGSYLIYYFDGEYHIEEP